MVAELKLDYDGITEKQLKSIFYRRSWMLDYLGYGITWLGASRTKHGWHLVIRLNKELKPEEICFLQVVLGSDFKREVFNWLRIKNHVKNWNVLFESKYNSKGEQLSCEIDRPEVACKLFNLWLKRLEVSNEK